jgi:hypothetical protein
LPPDLPGEAATAAGRCLPLAALYMSCIAMKALTVLSAVDDGVGGGAIAAAERCLPPEPLPPDLPDLLGVGLADAVSVA